MTKAGRFVSPASLPFKGHVAKQTAVNYSFERGDLVRMLEIKGRARGGALFVALFW